MNTTGIADTLLGIAKSAWTLPKSGQEAVSNGDSFSSSLSLRMATLRAQSVNLLLGSKTSNDKTSTSLDFLTGASGTSSSALQALSGGRNLSLFDPESAYRMMSVINSRDVTYKAQFSELTEMKDGVAAMQTAGLALGGVDTSMPDDEIKAQLQAFAEKYNDWIKRFDSTVKSNGVLAGTQAAEISLYELEQSVENMFNGARDGLHGLRDLGLTIDQTTNLVSIDTARLDSTLATNRNGAVNTITEFSANFARSAELLNSSNNFIPNRLSNLDRVIDYIADNKTSLQAEFGLGDPASPSDPISKALAAYNRMFNI